MGLKHYDCVFTTKLYNLEELKVFGARRVKLFLDSYDECTHRLMQLSQADVERFSCDVSAIGAYESQRASSLLYLAQNGLKIDVWGNGWENFVGLHHNLNVRNQFLFGADYAKVICATKINLNFLRKINRDEITSRSIEIPACGGFMLAERTSRHLSAFREGYEAEYFSDNLELLRKVRLYLADSERRGRIAAAGRLRALRSGYSMREQLSHMIVNLR